jgi:tripartite-type tricarboxylate transporter receptor subunit TctC
VIQLSQGPTVIMAHPSLPVKTVKDLIALAKAKPGDLLYASAGRGSFGHLATELFCDMAGVKMTHVPYKGTAPGVTDTIGGQTQLIWNVVATSVPLAKSGRLRALAVTSAQRIEALPDVPTVTESGLKGYEMYTWHGLIGPKNLPAEIVGPVNSELNKILKNKDMQDKLAGDGVSAAGGSPEQFGTRIKREFGFWQHFVKKAGITL